MGTLQALECVAVLLIDQDHVLAERHKPTKTGVPGAVALPGGHVETGEDLEAAVRRELLEELAVAPVRTTYACTRVHQAEEVRRLHYFAVERWEGAIENREAEALQWIPLGEPGKLDLDVDRAAAAAYVRTRRRPG